MPIQFQDLLPRDEHPETRDRHRRGPWTYTILFDLARMLLSLCFFMLVASCILSNAYQVWLDMQKPNFWKNLGFPSQEAQTLMRLFPLASMQSRLTTFAYLCISNLLVAFRCWNLEKNSRFLWLPCLMFFCYRYLGPSFGAVCDRWCVFFKICQASSGFHMIP